MISFIRKHLSGTNLMMVAALIFAMAGGAFAATGGTAKKHKKAGVKITSIQQITPKVRGQLKGNRGPTGLPGAEGKQGPQGIPGKDGNNGANGVNGKSVEVTSSSGAAGEPCEGVGGAQLKQEGSASGIEVCNGANGQTGFTETLPSGKTETGVWGFDPAVEEIHFEDFSFPIPLEKAIAESAIHILNVGEDKTSECPGTLEEPKAAKGQLCIYSRTLNIPSGSIAPPPVRQKTGVRIAFYVEAAKVFASDEGTWAVTAE